MHDREAIDQYAQNMGIKPKCTYVEKIYRDDYLQGRFGVLLNLIRDLLNLRNKEIKSVINIFILAFIFSLIIELLSHLSYNKSSYQEAVYHILKEEGGLENDRNDKGGITNYGISINFLKALVRKNPSLISEFDLHHNKQIDAYDIVHMNKNEAAYIYKTQWWNKYDYGAITYQPLADKILDISVNMGPSHASLLLVKACKEVNNMKFNFETTSKLNIQMINYINYLPEEDKKEIIKKLKELCLQHYYETVKKNPSQRKFLRGWIRRAMS
jgi:lysozyme family protein